MANRHILFDAEFDRAIYLMPKGSRVQRSDYLDRLKEVWDGQVQ